MKIFISHISEESSLAIVLKEWIESSFAGHCDVFVSSDKDNIPAGSRWLVEIDRALGEAVAFIVLCSPSSLVRPWVNFETGCGWIKGVPIIPICHSGQKKKELPSPISQFQALDLDDLGFVKALLSSLSKYLKFSKIPRIDENSMKQELLSALPITSARLPKAVKQSSAFLIWGITTSTDPVISIIKIASISPLPVNIKFDIFTTNGTVVSWTLPPVMVGTPLVVSSNNLMTVVASEGKSVGTEFAVKIYVDADEQDIEIIAKRLDKSTGKDSSLTVKTIDSLG